MASPTKGTPPSSDSSCTKGWDAANKRLRSVLAEPLGFPLLFLFDILEEGKNADLQTWSEAELENLRDVVYLDSAHLNLLQAIKDAASSRLEIATRIHQKINEWYKSTGSTRLETKLTTGISNDLNRVFKIQDRLLSEEEVMVETRDTSGRRDIVLYHRHIDNAVMKLEATNQNHQGKKNQPHRYGMDDRPLSALYCRLPVVVPLPHTPLQVLRLLANHQDHKEPRLPPSRRDRENHHHHHRRHRHQLWTRP
jgi:hypothetical protein